MSKSPHPSSWARDSDEEDRVEAIIRKTGCWDQHIAVVDCKGDKGDWRECQTQVVMFLSDAFGELVIDDEDIVNDSIKFCTPDLYSANIHSSGWFLSLPSTKKRKRDEERENVDQRAAYYYHRGQYVEAFEEYESLLHDFEHNRTHSVAVIDSLIRCALKIPSFSDEKLLSYLREYERNALDADDQLQYFNAQKDVYSRIGGEEAERKFIDAVSILCATVDLPEHWLAFGSKKEITVGENFQVGYYVRAIMLLERHLKQAHGFVIDTIRKKLATLNDKLMSMGYSSDKIHEARRRMGVDIVSNEDGLETSEELQRPVHEYRTKQIAFKTAEDCEKIVADFKHKFRWMFSGCVL
ncbi:hypothetical protein RB195_015858 [Necator americanus]|uniref:Tetratricopeptide repeat protein n=1 Tax=Necator americanus TaxID=51031 RepID=A0ABR1E753_NECAM